MKKYCSNAQCFKEKNYKAKFSTNSILKKINKDNLKKIIKIKKTHMEKHCSNPQFFMRKTTVFYQYDFVFYYIIFLFC